MIINYFRLVVSIITSTLRKSADGKPREQGYLDIRIENSSTL